MTWRPPSSVRQAARPPARAWAAASAHNGTAHQASAARYHDANGPVGRSQRDQAAFLASNRVERVGRFERQSDAFGQDARRQDIRDVVFEHGQLRRPRIDATFAKRAPSAIDSGPQAAPRSGCRRRRVMVEEGERPIGRQRREPQRQPRQLDRGGIEVDAEQAPLGDRPSNRRPLGQWGRPRPAIARRGPSRARTVRPGTDTRPPGTRRCPSPDRRPATPGSRPPSSHRRADGACGGRETR